MVPTCSILIVLYINAQNTWGFVTHFENIPVLLDNAQSSQNLGQGLSTAKSYGDENYDNITLRTGPSFVKSPQEV